MRRAADRATGDMDRRLVVWDGIALDGVAAKPYDFALQIDTDRLRPVEAVDVILGKLAVTTPADLAGGTSSSDG